MVTSTKILARGGEAIAVYDDRLLPILKTLGVIRIERATNVEFDNISDEWVATLRATGEVIARGPDRNEVIQQEVNWLEDNLVSHS